MAWYNPFTLNLYAGPKHRHLPEGAFLMQITHQDRVGFDAEVSVCRTRRGRGEIGRVEIIEKTACAQRTYDLED